ncbi:MAG: hypothetical protein IIA54_03575 [Chloroflexi bacterium]|nr:hypothetical protein [Chloroflexota bacterium]
MSDADVIRTIKSQTLAVMADVTAKLLRDGVASFAASYDAVLASVEAKCGALAEAAT